MGGCTLRMLDTLPQTRRRISKMGRGGGGGGRRRRMAGGGGSNAEIQREPGPVAKAVPGTKITAEQAELFGYDMEGRIHPSLMPELNKAGMSMKDLTSKTPENWDMLPEGGRGVKEFGKWDYENLHAYSGGRVPDGERFHGINAEELNRSIYDPKGFIADHGAEQYAYAQQYAADLSESLSKVQPNVGTTYRVMKTPDGMGAGINNAMTDQFQVGKALDYKGFVSSSGSKNSSYLAYNDVYGSGSGGTVWPAVRIQIAGKSGIEIRKAAKYHDEYEVLFPTDKKFMVTSKNWNPQRETWDISMREL